MSTPSKQIDMRKRPDEDYGYVACPSCGHDRSDVTDSRPAPRRLKATKRRRRCLKCAMKFTTYETTAPTKATLTEEDINRMQRVLDGLKHRLDDLRPNAEEDFL
jgi:transcriptional regulator NrdR family protein